MKNEYKKVFETINFNSVEEFKEVMLQLENAIIKDLLEKFDKSEAEAKELLKKFDLWTVVKESPLNLHKSSTEIALIILTDEEDLEAISKFYGYKK